MNPFRFLRRTLLGAATLGVAAATSLAAGFEGRVDMTMTSPKEKGAMVMHQSIRGSMLRTDFSSADAAAAPAADAPADRTAKDRKTKAKSRRGSGNETFSTILNLEKKEVLTLFNDPDDPSKKFFMRTDLTKFEDRAKQHAEKHPVTPPEKTGRTDTILGYRAEEWLLKGDKGEVTELWLTKELGAFMFTGGGNPMAGRAAEPAPEWNNFVREGAMFPLRTVSRNKAGKETSRMEVTKVEKTKIPDSAFSTEGYQEFNFDLGAIFGGGQPPPTEGSGDPAKQPADKPAPKPTAKDLLKGLNPFAR